MTQTPTPEQIAKMTDHSLLHPTMTDETIRQGLALSKEYDVATACVKPYSVAEAAKFLAGTDVGVCAVIGFPHGNSTTGIKVAETAQVIQDGATEVDMVINIGKALGGDWDYVSAEINAVNTTTTANGAILKVIFETDFLEDEHIIRLCQICSQHGVAFVKTSTGFGFVKGDDGKYGYVGATEHNLKLMREHSAPEVQVKASGGVRDLDKLLHFHSLGVTRFGLTATAAIVDEARKRQS